MEMYGMKMKEHRGKLAVSQTEQRFLFKLIQSGQGAGQGKGGNCRGNLLVPDWEGSEVVSIVEMESNGWVMMSIQILSAPWILTHLSWWCEEYVFEEGTKVFNGCGKKKKNSPWAGTRSLEGGSVDLCCLYRNTKIF